MPLIVTGEPGRWDRTPRLRVHSVKYRLDACPDLGRARAVQREALDWALGVLERKPSLPIRAARTGQDALWSRLTRARGGGSLPRAPLALQRAAVSQAHAAFALREAAEEDRLRLALAEQDEGTAPRTLRRLARTPRAPDTLRRAHPRRIGRRIAVHVLERVRVSRANAHEVRVGGVGVLRSRTPVAPGVRSAQIVEKGAQRWLHAQYGEDLPAPKNPGGTTTGYDSSVSHTLMDDAGKDWQRPDTGALLDAARRLDRHRARCCTIASRQWRALRGRARRLRRKAHGVQRNAECHEAKRISEGSDVVALENLSLRSMSASGRGTQSVPGSGAKRGLNESMARARLGRLHHAIERRCVRDGTWCVKVHPGGTSVTCPACGRQSRENRKGEHFRCVECGHTAHADQNAAVNIAGRARERLNAYLDRRGAGDRRRAPAGANGQGRAGTARARPPPRAAGSRRKPALPRSEGAARTARRGGGAHPVKLPI